MTEQKKLKPKDDDPNTIGAGLLDGFKRLNPAKLKDDIRDGDRKYIGGYALGYALKLIILAGAAYYGIDLTTVL